MNVIQGLEAVEAPAELLLGINPLAWFSLRRSVCISAACCRGALLITPSQGEAREDAAIIKESFHRAPNKAELRGSRAATLRCREFGLSAFWSSGSRPDGLR